MSIINHIAAKYNFSCRVCGDEAIGFNFGGFSCESCKAFFRRNAFNKFSCKLLGNCHLDKCTRKYCSYCRLNKCFTIGMKKSSIKAKTASNSAKSDQTIQLERSTFCSTDSEPNQIVLPIDRINLLSNERTINLKIYELSRLGELYKAAQIFPSESSWQIVGQVDSVPQMVNLSVANIKHIIRFCKNMNEFNCLTQDEQVIALQGFVQEIDLIRVAFLYNTETREWPALEHFDSDKRAVLVKMDFFKSLNEIEMYNVFSNFIIDLHREIENDPAIRDLIIVQSVFKHRPKMENNPEFVRYHNVVFHYLLRRYLEHKYLDTSRAAQKYTSLMDLLTKMDTITNFTENFLASPHITTLVTPVVREIYNVQT